MRCRHLLGSLVLFTIGHAQTLGQDEVSYTLRETRIETGDIFTTKERRERVIARILDALHVTTREDVIAREAWPEPGDRIDATVAAELERNLRALGLFAEADVELVPVDSDGGLADLHVRTRDRLSLFAGAGAALVGGVGSLNFAFGESNLLGLGDRIAASYRENSEGETRGSLSFTDLHVLDSWVVGSARVSRTDEGDGFALGLRRPFKHLADPISWSLDGSKDRRRVDYFDAGDTVAEVPERVTRLRGEIGAIDGPRFQRSTRALTLDWDDREYGAAEGTAAPLLRVPGDTRTASVAAFWSWQKISGFRKVQGVDTIDFVQDLTLAVNGSVTLGARLRDEVGLSPSLQPEAAASFNIAAEPFEDVFVNFSASASGRSDDGSIAGWGVATATRAFAKLTDRQTLATSLRFDRVEERQDLPIELTLGEDNGLRGYPARQFAGDRRIVLNLEHRFDTGLRFATFEFGGVAFFDVGWVGDGALGRPYRSAGAGLRIGSRRLLGRGVLRFDLSVPLDEARGVDAGDLQASITLGQIFSFGGNASALSTR